MRIEYTLNKKDYIGFQVYHMMHAKQFTAFMLILRFIIPIPLFFLLMRIIPGAMQMYAGLAEWMRILVVSLPWGLWVVFFKRIFGLLSSIDVNIMIKNSRSELLGKRTIEADAEGMRIISQVGETKMKWSAVQKAIVTKEYLFLYNTTRSAHLVPKRAFADKAQEEAVVALVQEKVNGEGKSTLRQVL